MLRNNSAATATAKSPELQQAPLGLLQVGYKSESYIQDLKGRLLHCAGLPITSELLIRLQSQNVSRVVVHQRDWKQLSELREENAAGDGGPESFDPLLESTQATEALDALLDQGQPSEITPSSNPFLDSVLRHGKTPYSTDAAQRQAESHDRTIGRVGELINQLNSGGEVQEKHLHEISNESIKQSAEDMDLFVSLGIGDCDRQSISANASCVARLAVAIGARLGLNEQQLTELNQGCLLHDAGLQRIDASAYCPTRSASEQFIDTNSHPILATDMLANRMPQVPLGVKMVVYQMHERCDGSGFPRGYRGDEIHVLAKIAAVADAYISLVSPRPHRAALSPYGAVKSLLKDVRDRLFDSKVVRGLLESISLFPIGSCVELSNGKVAKVLRSGGTNYDKPVVETWNRGELDSPAWIVDLSETGHSVIRTLEGLS